ncbi:MAG: response regulator transcription factor [Flavobacteriales bacterium]|nr:response regulator transcription factor [Flavobacteriales bacterium]
MKKVVIFEDNDKLRANLVALINQAEGFEVAGNFANCMDADRVAENLAPDIVIMDIDMPGMSGIEGVRLVKESRPETQVVMHTVFEDDEKLFQCLRFGASGYLLKKTDPDDFVAALDEVMQGGSPMSPSIARRVIQTFQRTGGQKNSYDLTRSEREVLELLVKGFSNKSIAAERKVTPETVKSQLKNIYSKLHVNSGKEAVVKALKDNIV